VLRVCYVRISTRFFLKEILFYRLLFGKRFSLFVTFLLKWRIGGHFGGNRTGELAALCPNPRR
jgi:hypothetical protein